MKNLKRNLALLLAGGAAIGMLAGCDEKKAAAASGAAMAEEIDTVQVDGKTVASETVVAEEMPMLKPGEQALSIRDPKLWAFLPEVIAQVNGKDVTKQQYIDFIAQQLDNGKVPPLMNSPALLKNSAPAMIKSFIDRPLLVAAAEKAGFKPSAELVAKLFREQLAQAKPAEIDAFKQQLVRKGKTLDSFIAEIAADKMTQERSAVEAYVDSVVASKIVVSKEEAQKFYNEHKDYFATGDAPDTIRVSHILIMAKKGAPAAEIAAARQKAEGILAQLKADTAKFAELAEKESACPSGKSAKGALDPFGKGEMVPEFEEAAFKLKDGEISGVVQTDYGFHIIRRDKSVPAVIPPFADVEKEIEGIIRNQTIRIRFVDLINNLEKENKVKFFVTEESVNAPAAPAAPAAAPACDKAVQDAKAACDKAVVTVEKDMKKVDAAVEKEVKKVENSVK